MDTPPEPGDVVEVNGLRLQILSVGSATGIWAYPVGASPSLANLVYLGRRFVGDI